MLTGALFAVLGCTSPSTPGAGEACTPGASLSCACTNGASGAQTCDASHTLGPCVCTGAPDGGRTDSGRVDAGHPGKDGGHPGNDSGGEDSGGPGDHDAGARADAGPPGDGAPSVPVVTIAQITDPTAAGYVTNATVKLTGVVATTAKFLSARSASGACSWGLFLSSPGLTEAAPHSALLALDDGTPASATADGGKAYCPVLQAGQPAGDLFPDDTRPGDVFDLVGYAGSSLPSTCGAPSAGPPAISGVAQYQLGEVSAVTRTGRGAAVAAPHVLSAADAAKLAAGQDATFLGAWGGARVTAQSVTAVLQLGSLLDPYGHMLMSDGLQVGDKLYYVGFAKATDVCYGAPVFGATPPTFTSITGVVYLDLCTWGLEPSSKCHDLVPPSDDCASVAGAGADAGASVVCLH